MSGAGKINFDLPDPFGEGLPHQVLKRSGRRGVEFFDAEYAQRISRVFYLHISTDPFLDRSPEAVCLRILTSPQNLRLSIYSTSITTRAGKSISGRAPIFLRRAMWGVTTMPRFSAVQ